MLAGNLQFRRCHSSLAARAHRRFATPFLSNNYVLHPTNIDSKYGPRRPDRTRPPLFVPLSTTAAVSSKPRKTESLFLKPRGKPKFRVQPAEDKNEFYKAFGGAQHQDSPPAEERPVDTVHDSDVQSKSNRSSGSPRSFSKPTRVTRDQASTADLERELYYLSHNDPHPIAIHSILKILIHDRQIWPAAQHYEALILANTWPEYGSVGNVESVLAEMEAEDIEMGSNIIAAVLKVLAIHPSPELSHKMLEMAERRWVPTSPQTHHHLVLAMIRTGQIELAVWTLTGLIQGYKSVKNRNAEIVPDYLVVLLIAQMVEMGDWEGVLRYFYKLRDSRAADREIPTIFWSWLLERASKAARAVSEAALQVSHQNNSGHDGDARLVSSDTEDRSPALPLPHVQAQLALSNPAFWLVSELWSYYASAMSFRPSWSTCLDILHASSNAGVPWLAHNVLATMTYLDGIDADTGVPSVTVPADLQALAEQAERRARDAESPADKEERIRRENATREKERLAEEDEKWWDELMKSFDDDNSNERKGDKVTGGVDGRTKTVGKVQSYNESDTSSSHSDESNNSQTASAAAAAAFDPAAHPPGNLWPFFPTTTSSSSSTDIDINTDIDNNKTKAVNTSSSSSNSGSEEMAMAMAVAIDPWTALGPRSSTRGRWTEGQAMQKEREQSLKVLRRKQQREREREQEQREQREKEQRGKEKGGKGNSQR